MTALSEPLVASCLASLDGIAAAILGLAPSGLGHLRCPSRKNSFLLFF